jgi:hypothetical protein
MKIINGIKYTKGEKHMSKERNPRPVGRDVEFWDYGKHELDGYQQSGDIHGKFFGTWLRRHDGMNIIISFGDETKRYWLQMGNFFYGNHATLELAAIEADRLLSAGLAKKPK